MLAEKNLTGKFKFKSSEADPQMSLELEEVEDGATSLSD